VKRFLTRRWRPISAVSASLCLAMLATAAGRGSGPANGAAPPEGKPTCTVPTAPPLPVTATTVDTIGQAYHCLFDHYVTGPTLDDRPLLVGAFAGLTQELNRHGLDRANATMPTLTGNRDKDWNEFSNRYRRVMAGLPPDPALRQAVAAATMNGMLASLHDNHVGWSYPQFPPGFTPGTGYGLGFAYTPARADVVPQEALPPLYVTTVAGGPAAKEGLRPGDIIEAVNGAPPFVDGIVSQGALNLLDQYYPRNQTVQVTFHRPATGRTWTATMAPEQYKPDPAATTTVTSTLLPGNVAGVRLAGFAPHSAEQVRKAIADLGTGRKLRGVVLDLRGNSGGSPAEATQLLSAFVHDKTTSYQCDAADNCTAVRTDDSVPLLGLSLVVLIDRDCVSACDSFSAAVKDLHLGPLIGTRTGRVVSGPAQLYLLNDNSTVRMPSRHEKGANGEIINGVGVAPDHYLPRSADDVSNDHDPAIDKALALLR
jgi:carboxyl-terminal processing protease